ncbi:cation:dicarboxylate symporter family transporter [Pseudoflavonifractor capillosus]|uniref:cation:dicarboxylate symporter family transporter n=1 Tax=Pseudoflavonifractor capillosus TaxID=106588 RepID=UPI0019593513|nr:dicarboxylate/amino acid:cation symporter [Pseudoflavonifractor capillosus]
MEDKKERKKLSLAAKTFIGFGIGIVIGLVFGEKATILAPLGDIFLNMIQMIVVPMVFLSITAGVASLGDLRKLRNIGVKVVGIYAITSALSVCIGLVMANLIDPGAGFDMSLLSGGTEYEAQEMPSIIDTLVGMFPSNIFVAFTEANMLQIIVFSVFLGVSLIILEERGARLVTAIQDLTEAMYKITGIVMKFSPIGVAALLAESVGAYGLSIFGPLGKLILTVYASDVILVLLMYVPMVAILARFPLGVFFRNIWRLWVVTASTTSSSGSLPVTTSITNEDFKVSPELSAFSLPLGATINMNGGCIYYAAAIVLTAQMYQIDLSPAALINIVISTVLVAMGCPGVPGGAIIMTTILLTNMGMPLEVVGLIAGIFRLIDMANTTFNCTGDVVTTLVVARSENMFVEEPKAQSKV